MNSDQYPFKTTRVKMQRASDYGSPEIVRVPNDWLIKLGRRGKWVKITAYNNRPNRVIYRICKGLGDDDIFQDSIELDYDSRVELELNKLPWDGVDLKVEKCDFIGRLFAHWNHPDHTHRVPIQLSLFSLVLGLIGLALGIISLMK